MRFSKSYNVSVSYVEIDRGDGGSTLQREGDRLRDALTAITDDYIIPNLQINHPEKYSDSNTVGFNRWLIIFDDPDGEKPPNVYIDEDIEKIVTITPHKKRQFFYNEKIASAIKAAGSEAELNMENPIEIVTGENGEPQIKRTGTFKASVNGKEIKLEPNEFVMEWRESNEISYVDLEFKNTKETPYFLLFLIAHTKPEAITEGERLPVILWDGLTAEIVNKILTPREERITQKSLFPGKPVLKRSSRVELKKDFYVFNLTPLRKEMEPFAGIKFSSSGLDPIEHLNIIEQWFISRNRKDLDRFLRLFAYMKSVREAYREHPDGYHISALGNGLFRITEPFSKDFLKFFIPESAARTMNQDREKKSLMQWFHENNSPLLIPILDKKAGQPVLMRMPIYYFEEGPSFCNFTLNTQYLEADFLNFVSIRIKYLDAIYDTLETARKTKDYKALRYKSFDDLPLKLYLALARRYNPKAETWAEGGNYVYTPHEITIDTLRELIGLDDDRIKEAIKKNKGREVKYQKTIEQQAEKIIEFTLTIAKEIKMIVGKKAAFYDGRKYTLHLSPFFFNYSKAKAALEDGRKNN